MFILMANSPTRLTRTTMKNKRALIACEFSGIVRDAFSKRGWDAWSCDILPTESDGPHYECEVQHVLDLDWDLMIAHPPCTHISNAGARHLYPKGVLNIDRLALGREAASFFNILLNADIPKICVENPIPSKIYGLSNYTQIIQPYEYGHSFQKKTCLWLKNLPKLVPTNMVLCGESTKIAGNWFNRGGKERQKNRAKTFTGIATAMAEQWTDHIDEPTPPR